MRLMDFLAAFMVLIIISTTASAATYSLGYGTETIEISIPVNQHVAYEMPLAVGDKLSVELEVSDGGPVDFFLTNETAYEIYLASISGNSNINSLFTLEEYSKKEVGSISYTYDSLVANELVVLIDNTGYTIDGAEPIGPVTIQGEITVQKNVWTLQNILITIVLTVLIIAFMISWRWPMNKKK